MILLSVMAIVNVAYADGGSVWIVSLRRILGSMMCRTDSKALNSESFDLHRMRIVVNRCLKSRSRRHSATELSRLTVGVLLWFFAFECVLHAEVAAQVPDDRSEAIVRETEAGLLAARSRLVRGMVRGYGEEVVEGEPGGEVKRHDIHVFIAFDFDRGWYRFDLERSLPENSSPSSDVGLTANKYKYCMRPDKTLFYSDRYSRIEIHPPDVSRGQVQSMPLFPGFFDIRALGLYPRDGLYNDIRLDDAARKIFDRRPVEVFAEGRGLFKFAWTARNLRRLNIWFDGEQGYSPIRLQAQLRDPNVGDDWMPPGQVVDMGWNEVSGVWVPVSFSSKDRRELLPEDLPLSLDVPYTPKYEIKTDQLSFVWESVNDPVSESLFDYPGLDLSDGTKVWDFRMASPVLVDVIGRPPVKPRDDQLLRPKEGLFNRAIGNFLVWGNVIVVFSVVVYFIVTKRK